MKVAYLCILHRAKIAGRLRERLQIRKLNEKDAAAYWALRLEALEREPLAFGMSADEHRLTTVEAVATLITGKQGFMMGVFEGESLVGTARFERESGAKERHKGHIYGVYLSASQRGRGAARELLGALISTVRDEPGIEHLLLGVRVSNERARSLYRAVGFEAYGIEPRSLKIGSDYIDEELMMLQL